MFFRNLKKIEQDIENRLESSYSYFKDSKGASLFAELKLEMAKAIEESRTNVATERKLASEELLNFKIANEEFKTKVAKDNALLELNKKVYEETKSLREEKEALESKLTKEKYEGIIAEKDKTNKALLEMLQVITSKIPEMNKDVNVNCGK